MNAENKIEWTQITRDKNGNPRWVCSWIEFQTEDINTYELAVALANRIGGKKYHTKTYGGGIVFQTHNRFETEKQIRQLVATQETPPALKAKIYEYWHISRTALAGMPTVPTQQDRIKYVQDTLKKYDAELIEGFRNKDVLNTVLRTIYPNA
jgi:hypothetical protein